MSVNDNVRYLLDRFSGLDPLALRDAMVHHNRLGFQARKANDTKTERQQDELYLAARHQLAVAFGKLHGWTLSQTDFGLRTLSQGKVHGGYQRWYGDPDANPDPGRYHAYFDHPFYYRRNRKAAAIAAHLYAFAEYHEGCLSVAARYGLSFGVPDFPSWWTPGGTTLVLYTGSAAK